MSTPSGRRSRRPRSAAPRPSRDVDYRHLVNPFRPQELYSADQIDQIHTNAVRVLSDVGMRVLLPEGRDLLTASGCAVDDDDVCRFDPDVVTSCVASAPLEFEMLGADPSSSVTVGGRHVVWAPAAGIPHVSDLDNGRRAGTLADWESFMKLNQHYDVLHVNSSGPEIQDVDVALRHYETVGGMLRLTTKVPFVYSRGRAQVADAFEMIRVARELSSDDFSAAPRCYTVVNTNSPLQLDEPMAHGLIDFARAAQTVCITPFTLAGAMAPVTLPGALVQQHAEFLGALCVHQLAGSGAPVVYGGFTSNVDMKSGAPAFGTPVNVQAALATGQLAHHLSVPWRSSMASTSNVVDAQAAYETAMAMWGSILGGSNLTLHSAGWMEGGLTASFEKLVIDVELLQEMAELMQPLRFDDDEVAYAAIAAVGQGGHFFGEPHTMERYETAFYSPLVSDWSNFGRWTETGSLDAAQRANAIWKQVITDYEPIGLAEDAEAALSELIARRTSEGGAPPVT